MTQVTFLSIAVAHLISIGGCATVPEQGGSNVALVAPRPGFGVVYVARPKGWHVSMLPVAVNLDGRHVANIGYNEYTRIEVPPGKHSVSPSKGFWTNATYGIPHPVEFQVEAGKAYYLTPRRWAENVRPDIRVIGTTVVPTQTADLHGTFNVEVRSASAQPPETFRQLSYTPPQ